MPNQPLKPIAVLGAGSWGTALALYLARRGQTVKIWSIEATEIKAMVAEKANNRYLAGIPLPAEIHPLLEMRETIEDVDDVLIAVPSVGFRQTLTTLKSMAKPSLRVICATKGLDAETGKLLSEVVQEVLGNAHAFAMLSGPSFAKEVAVGLPAAVAMASQDQAFLQDLVQRFDSPLFRIYPTDDVIGVEVGGVTKNVIAIATGIYDGMQLGANARSALITLGLAEIMRLGLVLGGKAETLMGLAGLGDLILTCSDDQSRNRRFGLALGKGQKIQEAEKAIGQVVEGKRNAELVAVLAARHQMAMPICLAVWDILQGRMSVEDGVKRMLASPLSA